MLHTISSCGMLSGGGGSCQQHLHCIPALQCVKTSGRVIMAVVVALLVVLSQSFIPVAMSSNSSQSCSCGVFNTDQSPNESEPLYSHKAFDAECDNMGDIRCKDMCVALATLSRDRAPSILCAALKGHVEPFKPLLFSRNCDSKWTFTGLVGTETISCHLGKPVISKKKGN